MQRYSDMWVGTFQKIKNSNKGVHFINNSVKIKLNKSLNYEFNELCVSDGRGNPVAQQSGARDCNVQHDRVEPKI